VTSTTTLRLLSAVVLTVALTRSADATLSKYCQFDSTTNPPTYPWFQPQTLILVYAGTYVSGVRLAPWDAAGMSQSVWETQFQKTLAIMNEQLGASIRLRYAGTTNTSASYITGAVLVIGDQSGGSLDYALIHRDNNNGHWLGG
jgi:hypothetical protein